MRLIETNKKKKTLVEIALGVTLVFNQRVRVNGNTVRLAGSTDTESSLEVHISVADNAFKV